MKRFLISILLALLLMSVGPYVNVALSQKSVSIQQAAVVGDVDQVKAILAEGTDVNEKEPRMEYTALHAAARNGRKAVVELLLEKDADINAKERSSKTPLYLAVEFRQKEIVELLLAKGADVNVTTGRGENALSLARKKGNTEMVELLVAKGATEPGVQDAMGDRYYEEEDMGRPGPGGRIRGAAPAAPDVDLLADPNEIMARIKTFDGLEKAVAAVAVKSSTEMRYWGQSRYDNRTSLARAVQKQVQEELTLVGKIAVEEKAEKTTAAIDALVKSRQARSKLVGRELLRQRRETVQSESSRSTGRGRTAGRSSRGGRYSSGRQGAAGATAGRGYDDGAAYGTGAGEMGRPSRPTRPGEELDRETQDEIRQWLDAKMDNKPDLAKNIHPKIHAEIALIRLVAVEEEAKKTTAAIDGILLARQVRFDVFIKIAEELKRTAAQGQDPRTAGRYGDQTGRTVGGRRGRTTRGGVGGTQQGGRTRRR